MSAPNPVSYLLLPDGQRLPAETEAQYLDALDYCAAHGIRVLPTGAFGDGHTPTARIVRENGAY